MTKMAFVIQVGSENILFCKFYVILSILVNLSQLC